MKYCAYDLCYIVIRINSQLDHYLNYHDGSFYFLYNVFMCFFCSFIYTESKKDINALKTMHNAFKLHRHIYFVLIAMKHIDLKPSCCLV